MAKVSIRFDYFSVAMVSKPEQLVDLTDLLEVLQRAAIEDKTMDYVQSNKVRILKMEYYSSYTYKYGSGENVETVQYPFWYLVFTRSRPDLPPVLKQNKMELHPLQLADDEYLSENTVMIYDPAKNVADSV